MSGQLSSRNKLIPTLVAIALVIAAAWLLS